MATENPLPAIHLRPDSAKRRRGKRPQGRAQRIIAYAGIIGAMICVGAIYAVSGWPQSVSSNASRKAKPRSPEAARQASNGDGTYTLEFPRDQFTRVTDPAAIQRGPARQAVSDPNRYLTSDEAVAGIGSEQWKAWKKREDAASEERHREWENEFREAADASKRRAATPPHPQLLKKEYDAAYQRAYEDVTVWTAMIARNKRLGANRMIINQNIDALNAVVANYASQYRTIQKQIDELVQAFGPGKRVEHAATLERMRGGYDGARAAAGIYAR